MQVTRLLRHVLVDEAVRELGHGAGLVGAADVLDDPEVAGGIVLNSFIAPAAERA